MYRPSGEKVKLWPFGQTPCFWSAASSLRTSLHVAASYTQTGLPPVSASSLPSGDRALKKMSPGAWYRLPPNRATTPSGSGSAGAAGAGGGGADGAGGAGASADD